MNLLRIGTCFAGRDRVSDAEREPRPSIGHAARRNSSASCLYAPVHAWRAYTTTAHARPIGPACSYCAARSASAVRQRLPGRDAKLR